MAEHPWTVRAGKAVRHALARGLVRTLLGLSWLLPEVVLLALGRGLGLLAWRLASTARRTTEQQLLERLGVDDATARALAREVFAHLGENLGEGLLLPRWRADLDGRVAADDAAFAGLTRDYLSGRGLILVTGHLGNWELAAQYLAYRGFRLATVARSTFDPALTELLKRWRLAGGARTLNRGDSSTVKELLRVFKRGEGLGILIDVDTSVPSLWVPFFGRPAKTPRTAADLALRTGAPLWFGYLHRVARGHHAVHIEKVEVRPTGDREVDALRLTADLTARIEAAVRAHPAQWVWMHRRWKSRPDSSAAPTEATA